VAPAPSGSERATPALPNGKRETGNGKRLSLAFFTNALVRGGAEEHMLTLLRGLGRAHFRLFLVCPKETATLLEKDLPPDVTLVRINLRSPKQLREAGRLAAFLRREQIGILHSHLFYSSLFASPIAKLCGVPVVLETPHLNELWRTGWKSRFFVDRWVGQCIDYYIAVSHANAQYLVNAKRLPLCKVKVIQNGCDLRRFDTARRDHAEHRDLRTELGFDRDDPVLVVIGRLEPQKGHSVMLQALAALRPEFPRVRLVCVGEGALRGQLEVQAEALQLNEAVRFVGYQSNVPDWLHLADVVVLPSLFEGLPLIAIEALAARRPMVASAVDGTPEVVVDGHTGLTVPAANPQALAAAIARLLRDPALALSLADGGHAWVWQQFTQERQIRETEQLYLRAWEEKQAASNQQQARPEKAFAADQRG
jgi:glycosyltransferase involved in cell wall biosynthesis